MPDPRVNAQIQAFNERLSALDADAAQLKAETEALSQTESDLGKVKTRLEQQAARGARIGTSGRAISAEEITAANARATTGAQSAARVEEQLAAARGRSLDMLRRISRFGAYGTIPTGLKDEVSQYQRIIALQKQSLGLSGTAYRATGGRAQLPGETGGVPVAVQTRADALARGAGIGQSGVVTGAEAEASRLARTETQLAGATTATGNAFRFQAAEALTAQRGMRSYGALTTEFFAAAARGTVTMKELGFQTVTTIQKFGGWLTAGAALYTALGALSAIGKGAIDSASGVNQLERVVNNVNGDQAQSQFRGLSRQFNLPISDITDAGYQMGKVFHDQNKALEASKSVLYAVKVGELDVASASRYLTAITQGFNLKARDTAVVFDQVNQAQNRYNISSSSLLAGTAKAAGAFKLAGGDAQHLIAIITTLSKATGQTGDVIGTAIQRSPHFIAMAKNQSVLTDFGIDPKQSIVQVYDQAIQVAQKLNKDRRRQLAEALFGPQYGARVGVAFLQQQDLYSKVLSDVSPEKAKGSAQRELNTTLGSMSERLKSIITELGILGSELGSAGFLAPFGAAVGALHEMLVVTDNVLEAFNSLPGPLRQSVALLLEAAAAIKVLRFFNFGQSLRQGGLGSRLFTAPDQDAKLARDSLASYEATHLAPQRERVANAAFQQRFRNENVLGQQSAAAQQQLAATEAKYAAGSEERVAAQRTAVAAESALLQGQEKLATLQAEYTALLAEQSLVTADQQRLQGATNAEAQALMAERGFPIPARAGNPNLSEAQRLEAERRAVLGDQGAGTPGLVPISGGATAAAENLARESETEGRRLSTRLKGLAEAGGKFGVVGGSLKAAGKATASKMRSAGQAIRGIDLAAVGAGFRNLGTELSAFISPLDLAIGGAILLMEISSHLNETVNSEEAKITAAQKPAGSVKGYQNKLDSLTQGFKANAFSVLSGYADAVEGQEAATADALSNARNQTFLRLEKGIPGGITEGTFFPTDVTQLASRYVQRFQSGIYNLNQFDAQIGNLVRTVKSGPWSKQDQSKLITGIRSQVIDIKGVTARYDDFAHIAGDTLQQQIDAYAKVIQGGFGRKGDINSLIQRALPQISEGLQAHNPKSAKYGIQVQALQSLTDALSGAAQDNLDQALAVAKGQKERDQAYGNYIKSLDPRQISGAYSKQRGQLEKELENTRQHIRSVQNQIKNTVAKPTAAVGAPGGLAGPIEDATSGLKKELESRQKNAKDLQATLDALRKAQHVAIEKLKTIAKQQRNQRFDENTQLYEARTQFESSKLPDGLSKTQYELGRLNSEIKRAIEHYGKDSKEVLDLLTQRQGLLDQKFQEQTNLIEARTQLGATGTDAGLPRIRYQLQRVGSEIDRAIEHYGRNSKEVLDLLSQQQDLVSQRIQEQESLLEANYDLRAASIDTQVHPIDAARTNLSKLRAVLAFQQAHRHEYSLADIRQTEAQIAQATIELEQTIRDQALQLADAVYDLQAARAQARGNEVASSKAIVRKALYDLAHARTPIERIQGRQALIEARAQKLQAIYDTETGDIQFQADIGKLTIEQQIRAYQHLLHTLNLTKQMRRDLREKIYQLKHEADQQDFDLNVGNIKLPTIYEIRRAIEGGINSGPSQVNVTNNVKVDAPGANGQQIADQLTTALSKNKAAMRAAGVV